MSKAPLPAKSIPDCIDLHRKALVNALCASALLGNTLGRDATAYEAARAKASRYDETMLAEWARLLHALPPKDARELAEYAIYLEWAVKMMDGDDEFGEAKKAFEALSTRAQAFGGRGLL